MVKLVMRLSIPKQDYNMHFWATPGEARGKDYKFVSFLYYTCWNIIWLLKNILYSLEVQ